MLLYALNIQYMKSFWVLKRKRYNFYRLRKWFEVWLLLTMMAKSKLYCADTAFDSNQITMIAFALGTKHPQGFMHFNRQMDFTVVKDIFPTIHLDKCTEPNSYCIGFQWATKKRQGFYSAPLQ